MSDIIKLFEYAKTIENPVSILAFVVIIAFLLWQKFTGSEYARGKDNLHNLEAINKIQMDENRRLRDENEIWRKKFNDLQEHCERQAREIEELHEHKNDS